MIKGWDVTILPSPYRLICVEREDAEQLDSLVWDDGVARSRVNPIVQFLFVSRGYDLNALNRMQLEDVHWRQFAQLIGYSVCDWSDLFYVRDEDILRVSKALNKWLEAGGI